MGKQLGLAGKTLISSLPSSCVQDFLKFLTFPLYWSTIVLQRCYHMINFVQANRYFV